MDITDLITIFALIAGPILAVQIQKYLELKRDFRNRKLNIFYTLMSTRATRLATEHVAALNMIDIDFYHEKKIINAWKLYKDYLNNEPPYIDTWNKKAAELFNSLLFVMAQHLGYNFDEVQLKRDCYRPMGHADIENNQHKLLQGLVAVLDGEKAIPMTLTGLSKNKIQ